MHCPLPPTNVMFVLFSLSVLESVWLIPCDFFFLFDCWCSYYCCCNCLPGVANKLHISLAVVFTRALMKLFKTSSINITEECYEMFNLKHMSQLISEQKGRFLGNFHKGMNLIILWRLIQG